MMGGIFLIEFKMLSCLKADEEENNGDYVDDNGDCARDVFSLWKIF